MALSLDGSLPAFLPRRRETASKSRQKRIFRAKVEPLAWPLDLALLALAGASRQAASPGFAWAQPLVDSRGPLVSGHVSPAVLDDMCGACQHHGCYYFRCATVMTCSCWLGRLT